CLLVFEVYGAVASPMELIIVMELLERGSLRTLLDDPEARRQMTPSIRIKILRDVAAGMAYLSENNVQHRDLKSPNVLLTHDWRAKARYITDFGLSRTTTAITSTSTTHTSFMGGTLAWTAPELLKGSGAYGAHSEKSDVYSFGVVVWEIAHPGGKRPWAGLLPTEVMH
ncbi:unnamed protein product, partial [Discosporangium mesarthrocarpum]